MTNTTAVTKEDLTDAQLEILEMIRKNPDATQKEFAEKLGITPAAVGSRVRQISGMNWMNRREFINQFFDDGEGTDRDERGESGSGEQLNGLADRVNRVEEQLQTLAERVGDVEELQEHTGVSDPDLIRKLVLTLTNSDRFSEDEADQLLERLLQ